MYRTQKSATCCYCGTKSVLSLSDGVRHELKCSACGAPLSRMKSLRQDHIQDAYTTKGKKSKSRKKKKRKSAMHQFFDLAEDVLDIFD